MPPPRPHHEDVVTLADGRRLGLAEYGDVDGRPVLWFHGTPGARRQLPPDAGTAAAARGLRVISIERPGAGWSTPHLYRSVRDWADDVRDLSTQLELGTFACIGLSGGGPYTLACAHELPDRVAVAAVLGGLGPTVGGDAAPGYTRLLGMSGPLLRATCGPTSRAIAILGKAALPLTPILTAAYATFGPPTDREVFRRPEMREVFVDDIRRALARGLRAPVYDFALFARHWGFELCDIAVPVRFWQGEADLVVPFSHCHHLGGLVANSKVFPQPGEGHFAGYADIGAVFDVVVEDWADPTS